MWFLLTAANKAGLVGDLAGVSDATREQLLHFETQWWSGAATAAMCGRRMFPEAGLQSKQNFTLVQKKKTLPNIHTTSPPSLRSCPPPPPPSRPLFHSQSVSGTQTGGDVRHCTQLCVLSVTGTCAGDPDHPSSHVTGCWLVADVRGACPSFSADFFFVLLTTKYQIALGSKFFLLERLANDSENCCVLINCN